MKRLTTEMPKDNLEAALNLFYIKDHETWVRGGGPEPDFEDVNLSDFIRDVAKEHFPDIEMPESNDDLIFAMAEWLMDGVDEPTGVLALLYTAAWTYSELRGKLMRYEDTGLEPEDLQKPFNEDAVLKLAAQALGTTPDHLRDLTRCEQDEALIEKKVCSACKYDDNHSHCPDGADSLECGAECFGCVCGECEGGSKFKPKDSLSGKDSEAPDAPEEPAEPEWKRKVMRTFLGGR